MNTQSILRTGSSARGVAALLLVFTLAACDGSDNDDDDNMPPVQPPAPPAAMTVSGSVSDGPVAGGTLFVFVADTILAALEAADAAADRAAALADAGPVATLNRDPADAGAYTLEIDGELAEQPLFLVFDSSGAEDLAFGDEPFNLQAVVIAGAAGSAQTVNLTPHTTLAALQVHNALDPDGDGTPIDAAAIAVEIDTAIASVTEALGIDDVGADLFPNDEDPTTLEDQELLDSSATFVGLKVRTLAAALGTSADEVVEVLAADTADGQVDGTAPVTYDLGPEALLLLAGVGDLEALGSALLGDDLGTPSCSASAAAMRRACGFDVLDDLFEGLARCSDTSSKDDAAECALEVAEESGENREECADIFEARLELCDELEDATHEPAFGEAFAGNFVDPLMIGAGVAPNPFVPLVQGNVWVYEGTFIDEDDGEEVTETITVSVTDKVKLIEGIPCLVVNDVVEEDGEVIEDTDDWFAQDVDGNVWYCGEIAENFETFEGDVPEEPELVDIDGSWKAGRDGAKAGILVPFEPEVGEIIRQEVLLGEAEDVVEILSLTGTESAPAASCDGTCLVAKDFTPLEPDAEENKYYEPGIGLILEVDLESDDRVELVEFTQN